MCMFLNKWRQFEPTTDYLSAIKGLNTITKLHNYILKYKYVSDKKDYWQTPVETFIRGKGDCEDFARFTVDVLVRIIGISEARFVIQSGYDKKRWDKKLMCHSITVFPYSGKLSLFSNNEFKTGYKDFIEAGKYTFPDGLKYMEIRDWSGKVLSKKFRLLGTF